MKSGVIVITSLKFDITPEEKIRVFNNVFLNSLINNYYLTA